MTDLEELNQETEIDYENNNYILNLFLKKSYTFFIINSFILLFSFISLLTTTILYNDNNDNNYLFWINQFCKYILVVIIQYGMAMLVIKKGVKVNYTRKVVHISYFIWPQILDIFVLNYPKTKITEFWNVWIILFLLYILSEHIRKKIKFIDDMFKAVDRPEDQPYTLIWFSSQIITSLIIIISFSVYFSRIDKVNFIFIPILINGLADGLAEPVGIRFGKHKYKTRACCNKNIYERSYEGSLCVFIVSTIIIAAYYEYMSLEQYLFCLFTIPIVITLAEAFSPHTWDSPFLHLLTCILLLISDFI